MVLLLLLFLYIPGRLIPPSLLGMLYFTLPLFFFFGSNLVLHVAIYPFYLLYLVSLERVGAMFTSAVLRQCSCST